MSAPANMRSSVSPVSPIVSVISSQTTLPGPPPRADVGGTSTRTNSSSPGPTAKEPAFIASNWGIGWQTPFLMVGAYIFALGIAVAHYLFFRHIDGREADGPHRVIPQSYVTTISNILANIFGYSLKGGLAMAFVQYLWYLLRRQTMKVATIELLFTIRANPFVLFRPAALQATPLLFALAIILWALQVVVSLPPGAITVTTVQKISYSSIVVPTFNASFMGNGSGVDANEYSLTKLEPDVPFGFTSGGVDSEKNSNLIPRLANQMLVAGESLSISSPCGSVNCSYIIQFEGPHFTCNQSRVNLNYTGTSYDIAIYNGSWFSPRSSLQIRPIYNGTYTTALFNTSVYTPVEADADIFLSSFGTLLLQKDTLDCRPGRALFTVNNTYINNLNKRTVAVEPIEPLVNLAPLTKDSAAIVPGFVAPGPVDRSTRAEASIPYGTKVANWTTSTLAFYRDNNHMAIFEALMTALEGTFISAVDTNATVDISTPDRTKTYTDLFWKTDFVNTLSGGTCKISRTNGTSSMIDNTRFNAAFGKLSASTSSPPAFNVTQDLLNDYLFNMTYSVMVALGTWSTTSNATISTATNVYRLSSPLVLILPYFLSLALALPFMLIGCIALVKNGVSAMDGSFEQIITTSTGSSVLDRAAAGGCLGGYESVPTELRDLKIRFGEFIGRDGPGGIKRAGFGTESEVIALRKGAKYGIARWL